MNGTMKRFTLLFIALLMVVASDYTPAQDRDRRFDPEEIREMVMNRMKELLGFEDEEWKVVVPLLEHVWQLQREAQYSGMMHSLFRPERSRKDDDRRDEDRGDRPRGRGFGPEPSKEALALHDVLQDQDASVEEIKEKLEAFRESQRKKEEELKKAREELRQVLTVRQEAMLVLMGTLE